MEHKVTTVKMVYATQVINTNEDYPSPSQFEEWKLQSQKANYARSSLNLSLSCKVDDQGSDRRSLGQLPRQNKIERRPAVIPESGVLEDRSKRCKSEQPDTLKSNIFRSVSGRPPPQNKPNVSRCNSIDPNHMKASTTSLASIASDIVVVSAGWFSSLRRPGKKRRKNDGHSSIKAKSAWDISNLTKLVGLYCL